jgi:hypothetical protein
VSDDQAAERLHRAKAGDGRAFGELLAPHLDPAFRLALTMLKDKRTKQAPIYMRVTACSASRQHGSAKS